MNNKIQEPQNRFPQPKFSGYQKILPLISDIAVSKIQCVGPGKPVIVIRSGQKIVTKLALKQNEIYEVFKTLSNLANIPLVDGSFKLALENYTIDGINSLTSNSSFLIRKKTAYSLLERKNPISTQRPQRRGRRVLRSHQRHR